MNSDNVRPFGEVVEDGATLAVDLYTLRNSLGSEVEIISYGAAIRSFRVKGGDGNVYDIVLGFETLQDYVKDNDIYSGAICGRVVNRIDKGKIKVDGKAYSLVVNNGPNHLHGGIKSFSWRVWSCAERTPNSVSLNLFSPDGEESYPGALSVRVNYKLTDCNELIMDIHATTTAPSPVDITNHVYFNLDQSKSVFDSHKVMIPFDYRLPIDENHLATSDVKQVENTPFDLRKPVFLQDTRKLDPMHDFDNFFFPAAENTKKRYPLRLVAYAESNQSRLKLNVETTQPGVQFYSAYFIHDLLGKNGVVYGRNAGMAFETQSFPNGINVPKFPSCILNPEDVYDHKTVYKVSTF